jgi:hypothetical protein
MWWRQSSLPPHQNDLISTLIGSILKNEENIVWRWCVDINGNLFVTMNLWMGRLVTSLRVVVCVLMSGIILFYITIIMPHIIPRILAMHGPIAKMRVVGSISCWTMDTFLSWRYPISGQLKRAWKIKWIVNCLFWWQSFDPYLSNVWSCGFVWREILDTTSEG